MINLIKKIITNKNLLNKKFNVKFLPKKSCLYLLGFYGLVYYKLPSYYFYNIKNNNLMFMFINIKFYLSFIKHIISLYKNISYIYSLRLKIKGLGFRIRKITRNLYYFFFNYTNMYYFYIPLNILFKWYKKRAIILSSNFVILKLIFANILILKKLGPYRLRGLRYPRQIVFIKKGGKKI